MMPHGPIGEIDPYKWDRHRCSGFRTTVPVPFVWEGTRYSSAAFSDCVVSISASMSMRTW